MAATRLASSGSSCRRAKLRPNASASSVVTGPQILAPLCKGCSGSAVFAGGGGSFFIRSALLEEDWSSSMPHHLCHSPIRIRL
jgi:hypothetical protein